MKLSKHTLLSIGLLTPFWATAGTMGPVMPAWMKVVGVNLGPAWTNTGQTQNVALEPDLTNTYLSSHNMSALFSGDLFVGVQHVLGDWAIGQLGLSAGTTTPATLAGNVLVDGNPAFNLYNYTYQVQHAYLSARGKVFTQTSYWNVQPYLTASVGVGFNRSSHYEAFPNIFQAVVPPPFQNAYKTAFTYTLGAGLQTALSQNWYGGIGYEFADWGKSTLAPAAGQVLNNALFLNHLYTNQLQFSLTTVF